ncbi:MAG: FecR domain-containing protein [Paenibacillus sp.]|nr:FecR domain-containing protein [Paenibacillus sp.]
MTDIRELLYRNAIGQCTADEKARLDKWAEGSTERQDLIRRLADPDFIARQLDRRAFVPVDRPMADMQHRISAIRNRTRRRIISIAASIALLAGIPVTYSLYNSDTLSTTGTALSESTPAVVDLDSIMPGTTRARLISASGATLELSASDTSEIKRSVLLAGNCEVQTPRELCLDVPRGSEFKIILEDSTEVWLNSESTLSYPEVFSPTERRVRVTGEAYFAVKHDSKRPFYVETDEQTVRVYGTTFNVRAYADDPCVYTTLEQGSISITRTDIHSGEVMLSPGHQALLNREDNKLNMRQVDPAIITGWRNGRFVFEEQPLSSIMRDLSRWYDFRYEFATPEVADIIFMGSIPRYADFATAISIIEKSGGLRFTTRDDKVIISAR